MKIRKGFVSNSSSSSFVVLLPDNFDVEKCVNENWEEIDPYELEDSVDDPDDENEVKEYLVGLVKEFQAGNVDFYENYNDLYVLEELLGDYIVASIETGPDGGDMVLVDNKKVRNILGC